jgi:hypothetical protein
MFSTKIAFFIAGLLHWRITELEGYGQAVQIRMVAQEHPHFLAYAR